MNLKTLLSLKSLVIAWLLLFPLSLKAQNSTIDDLNEQLRHLFSQVVNPDPGVRFLYDMSVHQVDSTFFTNYNVDTGNTNNWFMVYQEMYHAAYDTSAFVKPDTIAQRAITYYQHDTIPLGLMEVSFHKLKDAAINTGDYFVFDTINDLWYDKNPRPGSPYNIDTLFIGAPLYSSSPFANVTFRIDPQFLVIDADKAYTNPDNRLLKIDFGDGNGWQLIVNPNTVTNYNITYPSGGRKVIKFGMFSGYTHDTLTELSVADFVVMSDQVSVNPTSIITSIPGMQIGVYDGNCVENTEEKYVIYLEGFDFMESRNLPEIYTTMIHDEEIDQLKNFGYRFLVVNWANSKADIRDNAQSVIRLIEALKCRTLFGDKPRTEGEVPPPFVVIGESMGSLVARYALTYMESDEYRHTSACMPQYMHNTRLFISVDGPNQGANIPLGVQQLYTHTASVFQFLSPSDNILGSLYRDFLFSVAAKQMLLYHVSSDPLYQVPIGSAHYGPAHEKLELDDELRNMGNYPRYCKLMVFSNGALNGRPQSHPWDNSDRWANDQLLGVANDLYLRLFGIKIVGGFYDMDVRTNPAGNGDVFKMSFGSTHWKIKLKWFGIKIVWAHDTLIDISKEAKDVLPYCTSAGSYAYESGTLGGSASTFEFPAWVGIFFGHSFSYTTNGAGTININTSIGMPFFANLNYDISLHSDGFNFGFIPTQSSMDFQSDNPDDLAFDIKAQTTDYIMDRTPFDVVVTTPFNNQNHLEMDNARYARYETCRDDGIVSTVVAREIGDDSLYVENMEFGFPQRWEAEQSVKVGVRNPHYNYPGVVSPYFPFASNTPDANLQHLIFSRHGTVFTNDYPTFRANGSVDQGGGIFDVWGGYQVENGYMQLCCVNYALKGNGSTGGSDQLEDPLPSYFELYPNPTDQLQGLMMHYQFKDANRPAVATLYTVTGQKIKTIELPFRNNAKETYYPIDLRNIRLSSGVYYIQLTNGAETYSSKFVLKQ